MQALNLKPTHKAVKDYYAALNQLSLLNANDEGAVRRAFQDLLTDCTKDLHWTLRTEYPIRRRNQVPLRVDAALFDDSRLIRGMWEAKDEQDDLEKEVRKKLSLGYPDNNILFQAPTQAILVQGGAIRGKEDISEPESLVHVVHSLFEYRTPEIEKWEDAVARFREEVPEQARALKELIDREYKKNTAFRESFAAFVQTCRSSLNPNLAEEAVERMLIQHILTERIFTKLFDNDRFRTENVVAAEIEKVVGALMKGAFNRTAFLKNLEPFYKAIELSATTTSDYQEKQEFLNKVYERFFQGFSPKEADTHGIVYTPQPIVDFMVRSVDDILKREFGKNLGLADKGVHILDPFVGTGNFIVRVMRQIVETKKSALAHKYAEELHCNEVMLLPYYIASMNIEHEYAEQMGEYRPFEGICLVDTFELAEAEQHGLAFMTEENAARVHKQKTSPIFVVLGNPPYNMGQVNENDQNKNRKYSSVDARIAATYTADSTATLRNKLSDPYVRAVRWASDRIGNSGIVAFVTNSSFLDQLAFDGMRKHLADDFQAVYLLDLGGNVRRNPKLSGTTHNVFGIQVGVVIGLFVRHGTAKAGPLGIFYAAAEKDWRKEQKYQFLDNLQSRASVNWRNLVPDSKHTWLGEDEDSGFETLLPLGDKAKKSGLTGAPDAVFNLFSLGIVTNRDVHTYNFDGHSLCGTVKTFIQLYNDKLGVLRQRHGAMPEDVIDLEDGRIKWTRQTKAALGRGDESTFEQNAIRLSLYRPFAVQRVYFNQFWVEEQYRFREILPTPDEEKANLVICTTSPGSEKPFMVLATNKIPNLHLVGAGCGTQCFPFFRYKEDGSNRRENITDWALSEFRTQYKDKTITKWDIFHHCYAVLHHPDYRTRYAANLKRELPRIPFAPDFHAFAKAGKRLADLHVNYEKQPEYRLERRESPNEIPNYCVEKMRLGKDKTSLVYNSFLTLSGIPSETYEYRLGNRSALEWVVDQYQVSTDKRSGITNDPNRADDDQYIVRLIGQVIYVSMETVKIVRGLPTLGLPEAAKAAEAGDGV